jgi:hypothetical protein
VNEHDAVLFGIAVGTAVCLLLRRVGLPSPVRTQPSRWIAAILLAVALEIWIGDRLLHETGPLFILKEILHTTVIFFFTVLVQKVGRIGKGSGPRQKEQEDGLDQD